MRIFRRLRLTWADAALLCAVFVFVTTEVLNGALRYYCAVLGAPWLIYLPKLLVLLIVAFVLIWSVCRGQLGRDLGVACVLIAAFSAVGFFYTQNIAQVAFGAYVMLPTLLGILVNPTILKIRHRLWSYLLFYWILAAIGVLVDYYFELPWQGFLFVIGDVELAASREWWTYGVERVAGFSRASYEVAAHLLFLGLGVTILHRGLPIRTMVWLSTGVLLLLTTSKKTVGVYLFITLLLPLLRTTTLPSSIRAWTFRSVPWVCAIIGILLPVSTLTVDYYLNLSNPFTTFLFASLQDRLAWAWPSAFELVYQHGSLILGRGIGGIGAAQSYFEPELYRFADNTYLYLYVLFGITSLAIVWLYVRAISSAWRFRDKYSSLIWTWGVAALMSGWAANGVEAAMTSTILGVTFVHALHLQRLGTLQTVTFRSLRIAT